MGAGVAAAHRQNIVHRDLKPLNIMTQLGQPIADGLKILDFGLAKIKSGELLGSFVQAKTSGLMGSPFYMAPEQWSDDEPDARADVYSLGIILYQMLSGDVPFKGSSIPSIMKKHLTLPVPSFKSAGVDISPQLEAVVRHALEKEISARTPSVDEFIIELKNAVASGGVTMSSVTIAAVPDETIYAPSPTGQIQQQTGAQLEGTISSAAVDTDQQRKIQATREQLAREQEEKERVAREELAREAEQRRKTEEERERQQRELEEKRKQEQAEREERERLQREQMERVERQAKELEERLARLATSMPPPARAETRRNERRSSWNAGLFVIVFLLGCRPGPAFRTRRVETARPALRCRATL